MSFLWHLRWLIPLGFISLIIYQTVFSLQPITAETDFVNRTRNLGVLLPAGRVERVAQGIQVMAEPIYFDVRLPLRVQQVEVELTATASSTPLKLGVRQAGGWDYNFPEPIVLNNSQTRTYKILVNEFKYVEPGHAQRFLISAPGLTPGQITIERARVKIIRHGFDLYQSIGYLTAKLTNLWFN